MTTLSSYMDIEGGQGIPVTREQIHRCSMMIYMAEDTDCLLEIQKRSGVLGVRMIN